MTRITVSEEAAAATFRDLPSLIAQHAAERPHAPALLCAGERRDWAALDARVDRVAAALQALGIGPGDKVAMLARPSVAYVEAFLGTLRAGACAVPLSTMASGDTLARMIDDSDAKVLMVDSGQRALVEPVRNALGGIVAGGWIGFDFADGPWRGYEEWLDAAPGKPALVAIRPGDDFNIIYSSGTTGVPKGIVHSHGFRHLRIEGFKAFGFRPDTVTLLATPLYSNTTLVALLPSLAVGAFSVLMPKFDAGGYLELAEETGATITMLVPVQYERLLAHPDFDRTDLSAFEMKLCTSAPLHARVKRQILDRWPGGLIENYGLTEGGGSCRLHAHEHPDKLHTVGKPGPGVEIRILGEDGRDVPVGQIGEVVGRSPAMMSGYHKRDDATDAMLWRDEQGRPWFRSGDMGRLDEDGFLTLLDRKKDMIISGGFNIYAVDLEMVVAQHPDVLDVAVIGIPSAEWGETPLALVVPRPGANIDPAVLRAWANERLGKTQRISAVEVRNDLPRNSIGKILKRELREPYWAS
jgi:acyl-CoA synthetase (AMP-forming)/AMP-acid ligase II